MVIAPSPRERQRRGALSRYFGLAAQFEFDQSLGLISVPKACAKKPPIDRGTQDNNPSDDKQ